MCSILGYSGVSISEEDLQKGFAATASRGPDMEMMIKLPHGVLGFQRLAIMGLDESGMQPFHLGANYVVCNGEIYGFRQLKEELIAKGYTFKSESDCEVLLPLYAEYGVEMFRKLDAEFAVIIYDGTESKFIAARDPIGIRPLFYGYDNDGRSSFPRKRKI